MERTRTTALVVWLCGVGAMAWAQSPPDGTWSSPSSFTPASVLGPALQIHQQTLDQEKIAHLLTAAEHLDAAGYVEEGQRVRQLIEQVRRSEYRRQLEEKLAELTSLQAEIEQLQQLAQQSEPMITVSMHVLEVSLDKLQQLGTIQARADLDAQDAVQLIVDAMSEARRGEARDAVATRVLDSDPLLAKKLSYLCQNGLLTSISQPRVITLAGRTASISTGGMRPSVNRTQQGVAGVTFERYGMQIEVLPRIDSTGAMVLSLRYHREGEEYRTMQVAATDGLESCEQGAVADCPDAWTRDVTAQAQLLSGQTLLVCCAPRASQPSSSTGVLLLITPQRISPPVAVTPAPAARSGQRREVAPASWDQPQAAPSHGERQTRKPTGSAARSASSPQPQSATEPAYEAAARELGRTLGRLYCELYR